MELNSRPGRPHSTVEAYIYQPGDLPAQVDRLDLQTGERTRWKQLMPSDCAGVKNIGLIL